MVISGLHAQGKRDPNSLARLLKVARQQLLSQELVILPLNKLSIRM
jgi:hypothetical protein